ncbi:MAG: N-acetylmuramoyl-L-alanine amidase [Bryobacterales bacterium]|nr:N-acetylmuramoyl-L-alanine amidase [Bryobacterales bacterium]
MAKQHERPPSSWMSVWLHWRASQIKDPVARLGYLRKRAFLAPRQIALTPARAAVATAVVTLSAVLYWPSITSASKPGASRDLNGRLRQAQTAPLIASKEKIWLVEQKAGYEIYSNGLRIESAGASTHTPRRFAPLPRNKPETWTQAPNANSARRTAPAGIVYHTTESELFPFQPSANRLIRYAGEKLLEYVRNRKSYHYLIDRFGRVHRVVEEDRIANHAGWSVWADRDWVYVNLNDSFLGVAFEAQTLPEGGDAAINNAQIHAGRILTEMLRARYDIAAENCTTHGQVSVNPDNMKIGNHTDLGAGFPYSAFGLPDNYRLPLPSMMLFGFSYDSVYWDRIEPTLRLSLQAGDKQLQHQSARRHQLQRRYKEYVAIWRKHQDNGI